jgi:broad specificity phosphatase PhoE
VTTLILARHGETDWNRRRIWQGQGDPPLNALGREQAAALASALGTVEIDAIYSSDLRRALETAEIVSAAKSVPIVVRAGLREIDVGSWTGLTHEEILERFPNQQHDGESREAFDARVVGALQEIGRSHDGERVLVVTHGGVVRALQRSMLGEPLEVLANCGTYAVRFASDAFTQE